MCCGAAKLSTFKAWREIDKSLQRKFARFIHGEPGRKLVNMAGPDAIADETVNAIIPYRATFCSSSTASAYPSDQALCRL
jgi:hypothetical protein